MIGWARRDDLVKATAVILARRDDVVIDSGEYETTWAGEGHGSF